jgi:hypothetical protein
MQFVPYRMIRNQPGDLRQKLKDEGAFVVTANNEPFALMVNVEADQLEEALYLAAQIRAQQAVSALREGARKEGTDKLTAEEIAAEIQNVRNARHEAQ